MVQDTPGGVWAKIRPRLNLSSFMRRLRIVLKPPRVVDLPLEFHLDTEEHDLHIARVSYTIDGETRMIKDVARLWQYGGFSIIRPGKKYVISVEDRDTLLALHSVCTETRPTGEMVFDFYPPVLRHLRSKSVVSESASSREYQILDEPLEIGADIDYDPDKGMTIETGYRVPESPDLIPEPDLEVIPEGDYARIDKMFIPLPERVSEEARKWLKKVRKFVPTDQIPDFFKHDMALLKSEFQIVFTDSAAKVDVVPLPSIPRVHISGDEKGWLEFQLDYQVKGQRIPWEVIWQNKGQTFRIDPYVFVDANGEALDQVQKQLTKLMPGGIGRGRIPISQFAVLEDFIEEIGGQREGDSAYSQFLEDLEGFEADGDFSLPETVELNLENHGIKLRPYQREGIHWLTWLIDHRLHGLLADDMGLGKTIQAIAAICWARELEGAQAHSLIVCPKSVIRHWSQEIQKCDPSLRTYEYIGTDRDKDWWQREEPGIAISTYATITRDIELVSDTQLSFLVLDESTKIKNPQAKRTRAVKSLNAAHRIALSGRPVENRPAELWSVFDFLMQGHLGAYGTFQELFETPIINGNRSAEKRLGERIGPFTLRRLKDEVASDLPEKVVMEEWVELTEEQRELYSVIQRREAGPMQQSLLRGDSIKIPNILAILTKLKQVCDHPALVTKQYEPITGRSEKFDLILSRIEDLTGEGELVVLFSQYLDPLSLFKEELDRRGIPSVRLDGSISVQDRQSRIDRLNRREAKVALCSLRAMGHGINLTAANHVIHMDRWWNPAVEDQATDRLHRIGQRKTVFVHHIQTADTLEEKIAKLQERKRGMSERIMDAAAYGHSNWTREELLELLEPLK